MKLADTLYEEIAGCEMFRQMSNAARSVMKQILIAGESFRDLGKKDALASHPMRNDRYFQAVFSSCLDAKEENMELLLFMKSFYQEGYNTVKKGA